MSRVLVSLRVPPGLGTSGLTPVVTGGAVVVIEPVGGVVAVVVVLPP
jgi:hypothetical protein